MSENQGNKGQSDLSVGRQAITGTAYAAMSGYFNQIFGFVTGIILARLLAPEHFGIVGLATVIYYFISRIRLFGFNYILISKNNPEPNLIATHFWLQTGLTAITVGVTFILQPVLLHLYNRQVVTVLLVIAVLSLFDVDGMAGTAYALITKELEFKQLSAIDVFIRISSPLIAIFLAYNGFGIWALVAKQGWETLMYFLLYWYMSPWKPWFLSGFTPYIARNFWKEGKHLWFSGFSTLIVFTYDDFLVGSWHSTQTLGYYNRAYNLAKLPMSFVEKIILVAYPTFAKVRYDPKKLSLVFNMVFSVITLVALPASVGLALVAPELVPWLLGEQWLPAVPLLRLLVVYSILRPVFDIAMRVPMALEEPDILSKVAVVQVILMLGLCTSLTYYFGAVGAAISADVVVLIGLVVVFRFYLHTKVEINYWEMMIVPLIRVGLAVAGVSVFVMIQPIDNLIARLVVKSVVFGLIYLSILLLFERQKLWQKFKFIQGILTK